MAEMMSSSCLKLIAKIDERDQDAILARLDELQAQGVPAKRAQVQAAIDVLTGLRKESGGGITRSPARGDDILSKANGLLARLGKSSSDAAWTEQRVQDLLDEFAYTNDDTRSKAYAGFVRPEDFLRATTPSEGVSKLESENRPLDREQLANNRQPIMLIGESDGNKWKTTGHEGRHRMMALRDAGVDRVPVVFRVGYGLPRKVIDDVYVQPQRWSGGPTAQGGFIVDELTPISYEFADQIKTRFSPDSAEVRFSRQRNPQEDTPEFKAWFKQSKAVDEDGNPMVMYHGTAYTDENGNALTEFRPGHADAIYLTPRPEFASGFAQSGGQGANVLPVYVSTQNPFDYENPEHREALREFLEDKVGAEGKVTIEAPRVPAMRLSPADLASRISKGQWMFVESPAVQEFIRANHDGFYTNERGTKNLAVFKSEQIKSATGNDGGFDAANPDIRRSKQRQASADAEYMDAVQRGDMETAQRLVDQAARNAGYLSSADYRMAHQAPNSRDDTSLIDLRAEGLVPDDYWTKPEWYQTTPEEMESLRKVTEVFRRLDAKSQPGKPYPVAMTVYRSVPKGVKDGSIRNGDWVTPSLAYAKMEGESIPGGYRVITQQVLAKDLYWDGNSIAELGYDDGQGYVYKNTKNNRKLMDVVTRDDEGNIIPPSKRFNARTSDVRRSTRRNDLGFYSALAANIDSINIKQAPAGAWKTALKGLVNKGAIKQEELFWTGLEDWLDLQQGKVSKQQVSEYLDANGVKVEEVVLGENGYDAYGQLSIQEGSYGDSWMVVDEEGRVIGDEHDTRDEAQAALDSLSRAAPSKYKTYTLPGGENYREVLLTLPVKREELSLGRAEAEQLSRDEGRYIYMRYRLDDGDFETERVFPGDFEDGLATDAEFFEIPGGIDSAMDRAYRSSHWSQPNVLAHIRVDDRIDADGAKTLFVEEIQSDFGQDFKKSRDAIKDAVESNFNAIVDRMKKAGVLEVVCD